VLGLYPLLLIAILLLYYVFWLFVLILLYFWLIAFWSDWASLLFNSLFWCFISIICIFIFLNSFSYVFTKAIILNFIISSSFISTFEFYFIIFSLIFSLLLLIVDVNIFPNWLFFLAYSLGLLIILTWFFLIKRRLLLHGELSLFC